MNNILAFVTAHWAAIVGAVGAAHVLGMAVANFFPKSKAASIIETVYDYAVKGINLVQPLVTRNSQQSDTTAPTTPSK